MPRKLYFTLSYGENEKPKTASLANVKDLLYFYHSQDSHQWEWIGTRNISTSLQGSIYGWRLYNSSKK